MGMAGAVSFSTTYSFFPKFSLKPKPQLLFSPLSSTPIASKSKATTTKRKNYLRPKILKTIPKPFPSSNPLESPPETTKPLDVVVFDHETPSQALEETNKVEEGEEEFQVSETLDVAAGENSGSFGKFSAYSVIKFGFCFVVMFMLQTLIAVWVMGNGNFEDKDDNLERNKSKNGKFLNNNNNNNGYIVPSSRNLLYWDDSELEEKIQEIRAMAREARKSEEKELKDGQHEEDESLSSKERIGIEKEIGARLNKLEKKLNTKRDNFPGSYMSFLDKLKDGEEDGKELNKPLFIKKKFKFRAPDKTSRSGVKGFSSLKNGVRSTDTNGTATSSSGTMGMDDRKKVVSRKSDFLPSNREKSEKIEEDDLGPMDVSPMFESSQERFSTEVMKSRKSSDVDIQNSHIYRKENHEARIKSDKHASVHTSLRREVYNKPPANKVKDNQSGIKTDPWWLNLPYVLAILMQRGVDSEGPGGLFTLRIFSEDQEQSETTCTVAFEDRGDAKNFCYLLECFFEDLGDFSAEAVPMSVKELYEATKLHAKKVIVVKKGQLKLYAGQPFEEVEMTLQSLIEDDQCVSIANPE